MRNLEHNVPQAILNRTCGQYVKVGYAPYRDSHHSDGFAATHWFSITEAGITHRCDCIDTTNHRAYIKTGRIGHNQLTETPPRGLADRLRCTLNPARAIGDNPGISAVPCLDNAAVLTMGDSPKRAVVRNGNTVGWRTTTVSGFKILTSTPHPIWRGGFSDHINVSVACKGAKLGYLVHGLNGNVFGFVPTNNPAYMHSFALTKRYAVIIEHPVFLDRWKAATCFLANRSLRDCFYFDEKRGYTRFIIVDLFDRSNKPVIQYTEPFFYFHQINAWTHEDGIFIDLLTYPDGGVCDDLLDGKQPKKLGTPTRYMIDTKSRSNPMKEVITENTMEMPAVSSDFSGIVHDSFYGIRPTGALERYSLRGNFLARFKPLGERANEPVIIPRTPRYDYDILLTLVEGAEGDALVFLRGDNLDEFGRAMLPKLEFNGIHGLHMPHAA